MLLDGVPHEFGLLGCFSFGFKLKPSLPIGSIAYEPHQSTLTRSPGPSCRAAELGWTSPPYTPLRHDRRRATPPWHLIPAVVRSDLACTIALLPTTFTACC